MTQVGEPWGIFKELPQIGYNREPFSIDFKGGI
jgi:hypothetical protein